MYCSECGMQLNDNDKFCSNCGCPVNDNSDNHNLNNFDISQFNGNKIQACSYLCNTYGLSLAEAKKIVDGKFSKNSSAVSSSNVKLCCPKCKSINIEVLGNQRKGFSVGKAIGGAFLTGGIGTLAGFAGGKGKYEMFCKNCGYRWKTK